jgi:ubiquinone/menaquinone biosynthesis C-methylase UbiE
MQKLIEWIDLLRCPISGQALRLGDGELLSGDNIHRYSVDEDEIVLFAEEFCSPDAARQQAHYDKVAATYIANLAYPQTIEYMAYLDRALLGLIGQDPLATVAEICCGSGEAFHLVGNRCARGIGVDVSLRTLRNALRQRGSDHVAFVQGDATHLPLASEAFDNVFVLGGIHHVNDRAGLFSEIARILKPGGCFYFREPVSDFWLWRAIRYLVYRWSPMLDADTERPLLYEETVPVLEEAGLVCEEWRTLGFLGFCLFMNADVLVVNRLFRFLPGIRGITRAATRLDDALTKLPGFRYAGLQVVGRARKP